MASATYDNGSFHATLTVNESSTSSTGNSSVVSWSLSSSIALNAFASVTVTIDGSTRAVSTTGTTASGTQTVAHNSDGRKTISFSFSVGSGIGASGSLGLSNIPPLTPSSLAVSGTPTNNRIDVAWGQNASGSRASSYTLQYDDNSSFTSPSTPSDQTPPAAISTTLAKNTTYWIRVRSNNASGSSPWRTISAKTQNWSVPGAPTLNSVTANGATGLAYSFNAPSNNGGQSITSYTVQWADNSGFSSASSKSVTTGKGSITGLASGKTWYVRVRATNSQGDGAWSAVKSAVLGSPPGAPASLTAVQVDRETAAAEVTIGAETPDQYLPTTGFRVQYSTDPNFAAGVSTVSTASTLRTVDIASLLNGRTWYFRAAAVNAAGTGAWSPTASLYVFTGTGDLDGWSAATGTLLRSAITGAPKTPNGLLYSGSGSDGPTRAFATIPGTDYQFTASALLIGSPEVSEYAITAGSSTSTPVTVAASPTSLGTVTFTATSTTTVITIAPTSSGAQDVAFFGIALTVDEEPVPYQLQDTAFQGSLSDHFTYACDSIGASWWVDSDNVTQFRRKLNPTGYVATFTDDGSGDLSYTQIDAGFDTRNIVTQLTVHNHGYDPATGNAADADYLENATAAQQAWGVRSAQVDMTLVPDLLDDRVAEILSAVDDPTEVMTRIVFNAQSNISLASALEIQDRVLVKFRGLEQDSRIVGIGHDISPTRWMVTLDLAVNELLSPTVDQVTAFYAGLTIDEIDALNAGLTINQIDAGLRKLVDQV